MNPNFTRTREINEHLSLAKLKETAKRERDERLDAALEAARLEFMLEIEDQWSELRKELEGEHGTPFIYVRVHDDTWISIPPLYAEVEGEESGYALVPYLPSASMISERVAMEVDREAFCSWATSEKVYELLAVNALYAPTCLGLGRAEMLSALLAHAQNPEARSLESRLGPWGLSVLAVKRFITTREPEA